MRRLWVRFPPSAPRRRKLCIAYDGVFFAVGALTPLLLLSPPNPLRWALAGTPTSAYHCLLLFPTIGRNEFACDRGECHSYGNSRRTVKAVRALKYFLVLHSHLYRIIKMSRTIAPISRCFCRIYLHFQQTFNIIICCASTLNNMPRCMFLIPLLFLLPEQHQQRLPFLRC